MVSRLTRLFVAAALVSCAGSSAIAQQEQVYRVGDGVAAPSILEEVKPSYTPAALLAHVEGMVKLDCVVRADGTVTDIRIVEPLHPQLDEASTRALEQWRFKPGTKNGEPVPVRVEIEMTFTLRSEPPAAAPVRGPLLDSPEVFRPGQNVTTPAVVREVKPFYLPEVIRARVQGSVKLEAVVLSDGTVGDIRVMEPLDSRLDEECVRAVRQWTFKPGLRDGIAVPVRIEIEMTFSLR